MNFLKLKINCKNTDSPLISILVCARNEEKYISKTLLSLKSQDFVGKFETIVIDNDSSDNTAKIASNLDSIVVKCEELGKVACLKFGINYTNSEIIAIADADTIYPSNWLSSIYNIFKLNNNVKLVFGSSDMGFGNHPFRILAPFINSIQFVPSLWFGVVCSMGFNLAVQKSVFKEVLDTLKPVAYSGWAIGTSTLHLYGKRSIKYSRKLIVPKCMRRYKEKGLAKTSFAWIQEWIRLLQKKHLKLSEKEYYGT